MKYFEKIAFKYNKPGHIKKFVLMKEDDIFKALLRQSGVKKLLGTAKLMTKGAPGGFHAGVKELKSVLSKRFKGEDRTIAGTIFKTPKGTSIGINKDIWKGLSKTERRKYLAHEAFHADTPVLGRSEILAHAYGGLKSKKGKINYKAAIDEVKHLKKSRPDRLYLELGGIGAAGTATTVGVRKLKKDE